MISGHKICFASLRFKERLSGQTRSILNIIDLVSNKHSSIFLLDSEGVCKVGDGKETETAKKQTGRDFGYFFELIRFVRVLKKNVQKFDVIHLQLPTPSFSFIGDIAKKHTKGKVIVHFDSIIIDEPLWGIFNRGLRHDFFFYLFRLVINNVYVARLFSRFRANHFVVASNFQKEQLVKVLNIPSKKISVIPNFIDENKFFPINKKEAKNAFSLKETDFVITYVGHVLHHKGIYDLIKVFLELDKAKSNLKLVVASSGLGRHGEIRKIKNKNIVHLDEVDVSRLLSATDILCIPYVYSFGTNYFPNIILEALCVGVPLVTTKTHLTEEIIKDGITGIFAKKGNTGDLKRKITKLMDDERLRINIINNQRKEFPVKFNKDKILGKIISLYE